MAMARRPLSSARASTAKSVLPDADSKAGDKPIHSLHQLLTAQQRTDLQKDLSEIARRRQKAEAASSTLRF